MAKGSKGFSKPANVKAPNQGGHKPPPTQAPREQGGPPRSQFTTPKAGQQQNTGTRPGPIGGSGKTANKPKPFRAK